MIAEQLNLDLPVLISHARDDFFISESNREAAALIDLWPEWGSHAALVVGPRASGKSHLLSIWAEKAGARLLKASELSIELGQTSGNFVFALDGGDQGCDEHALLHAYNWTGEQGGSLLISALSEPVRWGLALKDLSSRLLSLPLVRIGAPDDQLLSAVMAKQFSDRQIEVEEGVSRYLTSRMERTFAAANALVAALDQASLQHQRRITVPLAREILATMDG